MKSFLAIASLLIMPGLTARGGDLLTTQHRVAAGKDYKTPSQVYIARTPYVLEWRAEAYVRPAGARPNQKYKDEGISVQVHDAITGKIIASSRDGKSSGKISVPEGGSHCIRVFSLGAWTASITEDRAMLEQAQRDGYLSKTSIISPANRAASPAGRRESVAAAMAADLKELEDERKAIADTDPERQAKINQIDDKIYKVKLAASRSSGPGDYEQRKAALVPVAP
jgi:hypothetical protein